MKNKKKGKCKRILAFVLAAGMIGSTISPVGPLTKQVEAAQYIPMTPAPEGSDQYKVVNIKDTKSNWSKLYGHYNHRDDAVDKFSRGRWGHGSFASGSFAGDTYYAYSSGHNESWRVNYVYKYEDQDKYAPGYLALMENPDIKYQTIISYDRAEDNFSIYTDESTWKSLDQLDWVWLGGDAYDIVYYKYLIYADLEAPGTRGWKNQYIEEVPGESPILWIQEIDEETLRPVNSDVTYEELAQLTMNVNVVRRSEPASEQITVRTKATRIDLESGKIGFQILDEDWKMLCEKEYENPDGTVEKGTEYQIVSMNDTSQKSFQILQRYYHPDNLNAEVVYSPLTDLAGNPVVLPKNDNVRAKELVLDAATPSLMMIQMNGSNIVESKNDPNQWPEDLEWENLFSRPGDTVQANILLDELIAQEYEELKDSVMLEWSVTDGSGKPVVTKLSEIDNEARISNQGGKVTRLIFENITITEDMGKSGAAIRPVKLLGANMIKDASQNKLSDDAELDITKTLIDNKTFLDNQAPTIQRGETIKTVDQTTGDIHFVTAFDVSDGVDSKGEGLVFGGIRPENAETANASLTISSNDPESIFEFKYAFTNSPDTPDAMYDSEGGYGTQGILMDKEGTWYLHVVLPNAEGYEIAHDTGLNLAFSLRDCLGNENGTTLKYDKFGIDNIKPELQLTANSPVIQRVNDSTNRVSFSAEFSASDKNGLAYVYYKWDDGEWQTYKVPSGSKALTGKLQGYVDTTGIVERTLSVKVADKDINGNPKNISEQSITFQADLGRTSANYGVSGDVTVPSHDSNVLVYAPSYSGTLTENQDIFTRVTLEMDGKTYVRVLKNSDYTEDGLALIGDNTAAWREVTISGDSYASVGTQMIVPDWTYYGTIKFSFASSLNDLTPTVNGPLADKNDTSRQEGGSVQVLRAPSTPDLFDVYGDKIVSTIAGSYREISHKVSPTGEGYYKIEKTLDGTAYEFSLGNTKNSNWLELDKNSENSYMVLVKLDQNGERILNDNGEPVEVTERAPLRNGNKQTFALPYKDKDGNLMKTGAYQLMVYVEQKCGTGKTFYLEKLLLDAAETPEIIGVLSYESTVNSDKLTMEGTSYAESPMKRVQKAAEGDYLRYLTIGAAKASWSYPENSTAEVGMIDGKPGYVVGTVNSLSGTNMVTNRGEDQLPVKETLTFSVDMRDVESYATWFGEEIGGPKELRIWNGATFNGKAKSYKLRMDNEVDGVYSNDLKLKLNWYITNNNQAGSIVSEEQLKVADHTGGLLLQKGENTICYQLVMDNGSVSPEKQFVLNIDTTAPEVELDYEFNNPTYWKETINDKEVVTKYSEGIDLRIKDIVSMSGDIKVYNCYTYSGDITFEEVDPNEPIRIDMISDGYKGFWGVEYDGYAPDVQQFICVTDASGNATCIYPITGNKTNGQAYENKNNENDEYPYVAWSRDMFSVYLEDASYEEVGSDEGRSYKLVANGETTFSHDVEYFKIRRDDGESMTVYSDPQDPRNDFAGVNSLGIVEFGRDVYYNTEVDMVKMVVPYDPSVPEGEYVEYTFHVDGYGWQMNPEEERAVFEDRQLWVSATNTKPALTVDPDGEHTYGSVKLKANTYVRLENDGSTDYSYQPEFPAYVDGTYDITFYDKFGNCYTQTLEIDVFGENPVIEISNTNLTCEPVDIRISTTNNGPVSVDESVFPEGTVIKGNGTPNMEITVAENVEFYVTYAGEQHPVSIDNINTTPIDAGYRWSPNPEEPNDTIDNGDGTTTGIVYGNMMVFLTDKNGSRLIDPVTGQIPQFTFTPGGETSYTFSGYVNEYGMKGEDVTVELPVRLETPKSSTSDADTYKPDVAFAAYKTQNNSTKPTGISFKSVDETRPADAYIQVGKFGEDENIYTDMNAFLQKLGWGDAYRFQMDIADENDTRIFLSKDIYGDAPDYVTGVSDKIDGVTLVGRNLEVKKNAKFVMHIVDKAGNANSLLFDITNLGEKAPDPNYAQVLSKEGDVRVYVLPPNLEDVTELQITNTSPLPVIEDDELSRFYGYEYLSYNFDKDTEVEIHYSYVFDGQTYTGTMKVTVQAVDNSSPTAKESWSANYDAMGQRLTNQNITVQIKYSKLLRDVVFVDEEGNEVAAPNGVKLSWLGNNATVIFENNTDKEIYLKATAFLNKKTNLLELPIISTIDKSVPTVTATVEYSENHRYAMVQIEASEESVLQLNGKKGTAFEVKVTENGTHTFDVADLAGNHAEVSLDITELITEDLQIIVGIGSADQVTIIENPDQHDVKVGDVLYVQTNRDAMIRFNGGEEIPTTATGWVPVTISKDLMGYYPTIYARDTYGNNALVQFEAVPMADLTAPVIFVKQGFVSASMEQSKEEIDEILLNNIVYSDDQTANSELDIKVEYEKVSGKVSVLYKVADAAGNVTEKTCWLRLYDGTEARIKVNGEYVERDSTTIVPNGEQEITIEFSGEPYKVEWKAGIRKPAQMKNGSTSLTEGYVKDKTKTMTAEFTEAGYYTFLLTTQGRDEIRFVILVEK